MKKLMGISVIAALAVMPMAANAARDASVAVANYTAAGSASALATTSYVQGAYEAASDRIDALVTDTAVAAKAQGEYAAIKAGDKVSENLVALDDKIADLSSGTDTKTGNLTNLTTTDKTNLVAAINEVDSHADANAQAIETLNGDVTTTGSVAKSIDDKVKTLNATVSQNAGTDGLALQVVEADGVITGITGSIAANTYQDYDDSTVSEETAQKTYTAITAGNGVGANLEALDSHVKTLETSLGNTSAQSIADTYATKTGTLATINASTVPIVTGWGQDSTTTTTLAVTAPNAYQAGTTPANPTVDCDDPANAENPACL